MALLRRGMLYWCGLPFWDGGEQVAVKLVGAVGGAHHAAGHLQAGLIAVAGHEQLKAVVDDGGVAVAAARPLVELQHSLVCARVKKVGDAALPPGQAPFHGAHAVVGDGGGH